MSDRVTFPRFGTTGVDNMSSFRIVINPDQYSRLADALHRVGLRSVRVTESRLHGNAVVSFSGASQFPMESQEFAYSRGFLDGLSAAKDDACEPA